MVTNPNTKLHNAKYVRVKVMKTVLFKFILFHIIIAKNQKDWQVVLVSCLENLIVFFLND